MSSDIAVALGIAETSRDAIGRYQVRRPV